MHTLDSARLQSDHNLSSEMNSIFICINEQSTSFWAVPLFYRVTSIWWRDKHFGQLSTTRNNELVAKGCHFVRNDKDLLLMKSMKMLKLLWLMLWHSKRFGNDTHLSQVHSMNTGTGEEIKWLVCSLPCTCKNLWKLLKIVITGMGPQLWPQN